MPGVPAKPDQRYSQLQLPTGKPEVEMPFARPFLKWAGGKTQLLPQLERFYPPKGTVKRYIEPFLGSGAVFFHFNAKVSPESALLWDNNAELIQTFKAVRDDVERVIDLLHDHEKRHSKDHFLDMRVKKPKGLPEIAARLIYLNKTCFNGLYRVNSRGEFNVPFGTYTKPSIVNEDGLRRASNLLQNAEIEVMDFRKLRSRVRKDDFVYFDPPYHPRSKTSNFTAYTRDLFGRAEQEKLAALYRVLDRKGCLLMLSNSDTPLIRELYRDFDIREVSARRMINSRADRRGAIRELVVLNRKLVEANRGPA